ncbi:hypothetical protein SAMN05216428_102362 [Nitrosospira sp. Nsp11]|uniref:hypothetical protein n=1 Tax=Nitrosospira sp. Nsp11 TaxID=1855338 RepID=UPI0009104298|nr:hypothetical protein [Nitrosospira sp. Nsp11]SHL42450.1 hypothetical protein SAMN05216428_102362 [Nitrosospira sp. Nsp11]
MTVKYIIAWPIGWTLYWLGHAASKVLEASWGDKYEWWADIFYPLYNRLMIWSYLLSDWAQLGIWGDDRT